MKTVVQRVNRACVRVEGRAIAEIGEGLLALVGVESGDTEADVDASAQKLASLRLFRNANDPQKPIDRALTELGGEVLLISQFTIPGTVKKGRRPSFNRAEAPDRAEPLYQRFAERLRDAGISTSTGEFGANMQVELVNDGPVTILLFARDGQIVDPT